MLARSQNRLPEVLEYLAEQVRTSKQVLEYLAGQECLPEGYSSTSPDKFGPRNRYSSTLPGENVCLGGTRVPRRARMFARGVLEYLLPGPAWGVFKPLASAGGLGTRLREPDGARRARGRRPCVAEWGASPVGVEARRSVAALGRGGAAPKYPGGRHLRPGRPADPRAREAWVRSLREARHRRGTPPAEAT
jgi:hypothetical protein